MRVTVCLPDDLVQEATDLSGLGDVQAVVELAPQESLGRHRLERLLARLGNVDLDLTQQDLERVRADD